MFDAGGYYKLGQLILTIAACLYVIKMHEMRHPKYPQLKLFADSNGFVCDIPIFVLFVALSLF